MLELAVVVPTFNESRNVGELLSRLEKVLAGIEWEVIFVDDDSPDGTSQVVREIALRKPHVRFLQRINRRGLSSACLEGMMATPAPYIAVMDADLQHDETLVPRMLAAIKEDSLDLVVASRYIGEGSTGALSAGRMHLSRMGAMLSRLVSRHDLSDPMSGFFLLRRTFLDEVIRRTSGIGFKILLDLVASSTRPVRFRELPYRFRPRWAGESKLDLAVGSELVFLILDKTVGDILPVRYYVFLLSGVPGFALHLTLLGVLTKWAGYTFLHANILATVVAMTLNFFINNAFTYRDLRLKRWGILTGLLTFYAACSIGALVSFALAQMLYENSVAWYFAGLAGMAVASVWNFAATQVLTWRRQRRARLALG